MPIIYVFRDELFEYLGRQMTDEEFRELCFQFGLELDGVTSQREIARKERGIEAATGLDDSIVYKIDVPANRYDLLCLEGLCQALKVFLSTAEVPRFRVTGAGEVMNVREPTQCVRPFIVGAVLRDVRFTEKSLRRFLDLQDKLHENICRKRALVAIGTHDLDTIRGPFVYTAESPTSIKFRALFQDEEKTGLELLEFYKKDKKMKRYVSIIEESAVVPVIYDADGIVLSMPPLINSHHSQLTVDTKNVFFDVTAVDLHKAEIVLNTLVAAFSEYCAEPYTVEPVKVVYSDKELVYPNLALREVLVSVLYVNSLIGITISPEEMSSHANRMGLLATVQDAHTLNVQVPITRSDILHPCDIAEDIAIAYGYNNVPRRYPKTSTVGGQQPLNQISDLLRRELAQAGYIEALTFVLVSYQDNYDKMLLPPDGLSVEISKPKTVDSQLPRTSLLPGLLKTIDTNVTEGLPLRLFELSDVVVKDPHAETGAKNVRKLVAAHCTSSGELEELHGVIDAVMRKVGLQFPDEYSLSPSQHPSFFVPQQAEVFVKGLQVGIFGVVHPQVLENFDVKYPVVAFELDVEKLIELGNI